MVGKSKSAGFYGLNEKRLKPLANNIQIIYKLTLSFRNLFQT